MSCVQYPNSHIFPPDRPTPDNGEWSTWCMKGSLDNLEADCTTANGFIWLLLHKGKLTLRLDKLWLNFKKIYIWKRTRLFVMLFNHFNQTATNMIQLLYQQFLNLLVTLKMLVNNLVTLKMPVNTYLLSIKIQ